MAAIPCARWATVPARRREGYFLASTATRSRSCWTSASRRHDVFLDLVAQADVVWENFRPGVMARWPRLRPVESSAAVSARSRLPTRIATGRIRPGPAGDGRRDVRHRAAAAIRSHGAAHGRSLGRMFRRVLPSPAPAAPVTGVGRHVDLSLLDCQVSLLSYLASTSCDRRRRAAAHGSAHTSVVPYGSLPPRRSPDRPPSSSLLAGVLPCRRASGVDGRSTLRRQRRSRRPTARRSWR